MGDAGASNGDDFDETIDSLFFSLKREFQKSVESLKETIGRVCNKIENQVEYIKDEIDVRIESIKGELDKLGDLLKNDLNNSKEELLSRVDCINVEEYEKELEALEYVTQHRKKDQNEESFEKFQMNLIYVDKIIDYLNNLDCQITLNVNQCIIEQSLIGSVIYNYRYNDEIKDLNLRIKSSKYTTIHNKNAKNADISSLCALPNGFLLTLNFLRRSLTLYNKKFEIVNEIHREHQIFEKICDLSCATTNNVDKIYITDNNQVIIVTDFDFNIINSIGIKDPNPKQFYNHRGICFYTNSLYVCDTRNQKIQKLTANLEFEGVYPLDFRPVQIKISNSIACIVPSILDECECVYFYDLPTFSLRSKYDGHNNGMIEIINAYFYEFCDDNRKLYCYDQNGQLYDEIQTEFNPNEFECFNAITYFNDNLVLYSEPCFIVI